MLREDKQLQLVKPSEDDLRARIGSAKQRAATMPTDIFRRIAEREARDLEESLAPMRWEIWRKGAAWLTLDPAQYSAQHDDPIVTTGSRGNQRLWLFRDRLFWADSDLEAHDVRALVLEKENRKRLKLEKAHSLMAMREQLASKAKRQPIPQEVKVTVWQRDRGRCVECGSQEELEYDHIIPLAMGGSNTDRNLQLLCAVCNRRKGATLG